MKLKTDLCMWLKSIKTNYIILIIISILFYLLNRYTPLHSDDWHYHLIFGTNNPICSLYDILTSQYNHYFEYNGRFIPHFVIQFFDGITGKEFFNVCNTLVLLIFLFIISFISTKKREEYSIYMIICFAIILIFLPCFWETFLWMSGACNYLWVATFWLIFHYILSCNINNYYIYPLLFILGVICGWTHEGLILGAGFGYLIYYYYHRTELTSARIILLTGLYLGILLLIISPSNINKATNTGTFDLADFGRYIGTILSFKQSYILILSILSITILKWKYQISLTSFIKKNLFYIASIIGTLIFIIMIKSGNQRSHFGVEIFSLIILMKTIPMYHFSTKTISFIRLTPIIILAPVIITAYYNHKECKNQLLQVQNNSCIIKTNEVKTNEFIEKFLVKLYISESNEFYEACSPKHYNNKFMAKAFNKDSILFLPEKFVNQITFSPEMLSNFSIPSEFPFYAKEIKRVNIKKVKYILEPTDFDKLPFYIKLFAPKLQRYTLNELETDKWNIVNINHKNYLLVRKNWILDNRLKDIIYE